MSVIDLFKNLPTQNYKTLIREHRAKLHDIVFSNDFLNMTPFIVTGYKMKNRQTRLQVINFCVSKDSIRVKMHPMEWERIFANHISDKMLIPRIFKELL